MMIMPPLHTLPFTHSAGLLGCSPASGMSHRADGRRTSGGAGCGLARGRVLLVNAQAARSTAARSASGPYHAAVAALWCGRAVSRKFMQYTEIIPAILCSTAMEIDINSHISPCMEITMRKIRYAKRKMLDYIAAWRELCYTVAQKELLYA